METSATSSVPMSNRDVSRGGLFNKILLSIQALTHNPPEAHADDVVTTKLEQAVTYKTELSATSSDFATRVKHGAILSPSELFNKIPF